MILPCHDEAVRQLLPHCLDAMSRGEIHLCLVWRGQRHRNPPELLAELAQREAELAAAVAQGASRARTNPITYHLNWLRSMLARGDDLPGWRSSPGEVWAMRVGDCAVVGTPGEVFSEIGMRVRSASPFATTLFAGYCQGILGYVATAEEHPYGGYEPAVAQRGYDHPAPFAPETADLLVTTSLELLAELYEGSI